ncbi:MAG: response regulator transcription factor [Planctomycetaceae bacterium]|nr:response regulator transcription factor [Planctomycetaceae bacterium]
MSGNEPTRNSTTSNANAIRVLIVDDHSLVRRGMVELLSHESDLIVCGEAADLPSAFRLLHETRPDVAVVDITLNSGNGLELIKEIKSSHPQVRIVVSSMHDETLFGERCLRAGAAGYVNKEEAAEKVVDAIRTVLTGRLYLSEQLAQRMLMRAVGQTDSATASPLDTLTDRELEVFALIGAGQTTRQIAEKLDLSVKTIESYRENIKTKLKLKNAAELSLHAVHWTMENH